MPRVHNQISRGSLNDAVKSILGIEKGDDGLERFSETLGIQLDPWSRDEWLQSLGVLRWSTGPQGIAAAVGNQGRLQVQNPLNSGKIVTVTYAALIGQAAASVVEFSLDGAEIVAGLARASGLDTRVPVIAANRPVATQHAVANNLPATSGLVIDRSSALGGTDVVVRNPRVVLVEGTRAEITLLTLNAAAVFLIAGYERNVLTTELP